MGADHLCMFQELHLDNLLPWFPNLPMKCRKSKDEISIIKNILDVVKKKNKKVLITIDEVMHDRSL